MAAVAHTKTSMGRDLTGINLIDATFQTLVAGGANGATFVHDINDLIILKNDTGGDAIFTFVVANPPGSLATFGLTVSNPTKTVVTAKTWAIRLADLFKHPTTGVVTITCDVAGKLLVLNLT